MSDTPDSGPGTIGWVDLTVADADQLREFYEEVVGWRSAPVDMGGYHDHAMCDPSSGAPRAGVCHARGVNAGLPPVWLVYVNVEDLDVSLDRCRAGGGAVVHGPRTMGAHGRFAVIRDPAGAWLALFEPTR